MVKRFPLPVAGLLILLSASLVVAAQSDVCEALAKQAFSNILAECDSTRNTACFGNPAIAGDFTTSADFEAVGDSIPLSAINSLSLSSMDTDDDEWGTALLTTQANIANDMPDQNVSILAFGDVTLQSAVNQEVAALEDSDENDEITLVLFDVTPNVSTNVNVRGGPGTSFRIIDILPPGEIAVADGRNEAGDWVRVTLPDAILGWLFVGILNIEGDVEELPIVPDDLPAGIDNAPNEILVGDVVRGAISNDNFGSFYTFSVQVGDVIDVSMTAEADSNLDTYLEIRDPDGNILTSNDDSGVGSNPRDARISAFVIPETGEYTIYASRFEQRRGNSTGGFTLSLEYNLPLSYRSPMQSFYLETGSDDAPCEGVTESGILIQTPQDVEFARLLINEVRVDLGSTVFIQAEADGVMTIYAIEGRTRVEAEGAARFLPEGSRIDIPLDGDLAPSGLPGKPEPYILEDVILLPTNLLLRNIDIADPIADNDINAGDVTITLSWDTKADLDLQLVEPDGTVVFHDSPTSFSGAVLSEDANAECTVNPGSVERITWPSGQPLLGEYTVQVRVFDLCGEDEVNWELKITIGNEVIFTESGSENGDFTFVR